MGECLRLHQEVYVFKLYFQIGCEVSCSCTLIFFNSTIRHRVCQVCHATFLLQSFFVLFSLICLCFHLFIIEHVTHNYFDLIPGEDLLAIAADQPFRFPATFIFVVRAFSGTFSKCSQFISHIVSE